MGFIVGFEWCEDECPEVKFGITVSNVHQAINGLAKAFPLKTDEHGKYRMQNYALADRLAMFANDEEFTFWGNDITSCGNDIMNWFRGLVAENCFSENDFQDAENWLNTAIAETEAHAATKRSAYENRLAKQEERKNSADFIELQRQIDELRKQQNDILAAVE